MPRLLTEPPYSHGAAQKTAVLLINLGTPDAPDTSAVRRYLREFLSDRRVVELPRFLWWPVLHGIILNLRPKRSARKYAEIWTSEGSPLKVHSQRQSTLLREFLRQQGHKIEVEYALRYGQPSIAQTLSRLKAAGCTRILLLPLYPQYSSSTTATALDAAFSWLSAVRNQPEIRTVRSFAGDPGYIDALASLIRTHWKAAPRSEKLADHCLLMSFHGLPRNSLDLGDPYFCECQKTGRLLAEALNLSTHEYRISFQSRFGYARWLEPSTTATLAELAGQGISRVDVICPGFTVDCLETLEEIALEGKATFLQAGGKDYQYIGCLNEHDNWIRALGDLVEAHLQGWPTRYSPSPHTLQSSALRAREMGADH